MHTDIKFTSIFFALSFAAIASFYHFNYNVKNWTHLGKITKFDTENYYISSNKNSIVDDFLKIVIKGDELTINQAIYRIELNWKESYEIMLFESIYYSENTSYANRLMNLLKEKTGKNYDFDFDKWYQYFWNKDATYEDIYFEFKAKIYERIDSKFGSYFLDRSAQSKIRLDEVRWGGVHQDGIPPLRNPKMISSKEATYLKDSDIVFGIEVNGDTRAYPKRILAWHEMFVDTVGDTPVAGVYCTLCGTVILYKTEYNGVDHEIGTSGFLYRSNKLMYDKKSQSLWSTLEGEPVIGPLVGKGIKLEYLSVVTTTWGEWKNRHPETMVLSLKTGHRRDYNEGIAYQSYFATDDLMFTIPKIDKSLKNKDQILSVQLPDITDKKLAISSNFLKKNKIYQSTIADVNFTVFTDKSGAHRVYKTKNTKFLNYDGYSTVTDKNQNIWKLNEESMKNKNGQTLERLPTYNAFWFGYKAAFPETKLIK